MTWASKPKRAELPIVYQTADEIDYYRQRYAAGLTALTADISLETPTA